MKKVPLLEKFRVAGQSRNRPLKASLELTYRCNERCTHCYLPTYQDDQDRRLTLEEWKHVVRELRGGGVLFLTFMGGEAILHPDFWELSSYATEQGMASSLITNGYAIGPTQAKRLKEVRCHYITVSLYSLDPKVHDAMTQKPGSHQRLLQAMALMKAEGLKVAINCLLTRTNIEDYFALEDWAKSNGYAIQCDNYITAKFDGDRSPTRYRATETQLLAYYRKRAEQTGFVQAPNPLGRNEALCGVAKGKCAVTAYGELLTCIEVREPLGNLKDTPFQELWFNATAKKWRELKGGDISVGEREAGYCDHCPGSAHNATGDPTRVSDYTRLIARVKATVHEEHHGKA